MNHPTHHIFAFNPATLAEWCGQHGMKPFRAKQVLEWVYRHGVVDPAAMTNLSQRDRDTLAAEMTFLSGDVIAEQLATDGTRKLLVEWTQEAPRDRGIEASRLPIVGQPAGDSSRQTECVMIPSLDVGPEGRPTRRTACISSQVGCPVGCRFCASGLGGLDGNLTTGRIVEQVWRLDRLVKGGSALGGSGLGGSALRADIGGGSALGGSALRADISDDSPRTSARSAEPPDDPQARISNVVFMGMGEPLANFRAVTDAVRTLAADWGMGISARKITVSTVGMHKAIERLAEELDLPVTLALSLHAPNDALRRELIPWAEFTTIDQLLAACSRWFQKTGREITLEYTLLRGVNDREEHAHELAAVAAKLRANVNLIRFNEVAGVPFHRPGTTAVRRFQDVLRQHGVNTHLRASRGRDIAAACGQLRHEHAGSA